MSAAWLASAELRAARRGRRAAVRRLAGGNDALARALAAELGDRVASAARAVGLTLRNDGRGASAGARRSTSATTAPCWPCRCRSRSRSLPALRERAGLRASAVGCREQAARPARGAGTDPPRCRGSRRRSGPGRRAVAAAGLRRSPPRFAGGAARDRSARASRIGSDRWLAALQHAPPGAATWPARRCSRAGATSSQRGSYACHPPGWSRQDDEEVAAPHGRIHLAGEHTAAEFCGTFEGALRSGARAAAEVLAERCTDCDSH